MNHGVRMFVSLIGDTIAAIITGWVISLLWTWFIVGFGLPAIGVVHGIGIAVLFGVLTNQYIPGREADEEFVNMLLYNIIQPLVVLGIGFVAHLFM